MGNALITVKAYKTISDQIWRFTIVVDLPGSQIYDYAPENSVICVLCVHIFSILDHIMSPNRYWSDSCLIDQILLRLQR